MPNIDSAFCPHDSVMTGASGFPLCLDCGGSVGTSATAEREQVGETSQAIPTSTTPTIPGYRVVRSLGVVGAEGVHGLGFGRDFLIGLTNTFGGRSGSAEGGLRQARETALHELKRAAVGVGGNGLNGVAFDSQVANPSNGGTMLMLIATGTAVIIEEEAPSTK